MGDTQIIHGDLLQVLRNPPPTRYHAIVSDPPYGIAFMNKAWDTHVTPQQYQAWVTEWASLLIEHWLFPGAVCLFFGGTRTYHRLACGLEDAGFEVQDSLIYMYGSGFPKGINISKAIDKAAGEERVVGTKPDRWTQKGGVYNMANDREQNEVKVTAPATPAAQTWAGYRTALKPAFEPVVLCRAPRGGYTYAELALQFGTGALNIDGCRVPVVGDDYKGKGGGNGRNEGGDSSPHIYSGGFKRTLEDHERGRYPANILLDEDAAQLLDKQSGESKSTERYRSRKGLGYGSGAKGTPYQLTGYTDTGGTSRFFFTSKAAVWERDAGLNGFDEQPGGMSGTADQSLLTGSGNIRNNMRHNPHPTVKPIQLCEYLCTLLLPPTAMGTRRMLIPFAGVGSEMVGAQLAGWDEIAGIEITDEYIPIAQARLAWWAKYSNYEQAYEQFRTNEEARKLRELEAAAGVKQESLFD